MSFLDLSIGSKPTFAMAERSNDPPNLKRDLIFLILQFLDEEKYSETIHKLEKESGVYFNMKHFEDTILVGNWEEAENYINGFITIKESAHSSMLFFHLRWHKYFESIIRGDKVKALDILNKELKVFEPNYPQLFKELAQYLIIPSYKENSSLSFESYVKSLRTAAVADINNVVVSHPLLCNKLHFPVFSNKRLHTLISQSLKEFDMVGNNYKEK